MRCRATSTARTAGCRATAAAALSISGRADSRLTSWPSIDSAALEVERRRARRGPARPLRRRARSPRARAFQPARDTSRRCRCAGSRGARDRAGDRALARARRAVDGDDQRLPHVAIISAHAAAAKERSRSFWPPGACSDRAALAAAPRTAAARAFVVIAAGMQGPARRVAEWHTTSVSRDVGVPPFRGAAARCGTRAISRIAPTARGILLVPGVHASGIDEPRLVGFARDIAAIGHPVLTVELPDLMRYEITARTTDMIEDAAAWTMRRAEYRGARRPDRHARDQLRRRAVDRRGRAARDSQRRRVRAGVRRPRGSAADAAVPVHRRPAGRATRPPHDYGLAIVLLGAADRVVPAPQVAAAADGDPSFLEASRLDMVDKAKAATEFERAKTLAMTLDGTGADLHGLRERARRGSGSGRCCCPTWRSSAAIRRYRPRARPRPSAASTSFTAPTTTSSPRSSRRCSRSSRGARARGARSLLTPLITHAEVDGRRLSAIWRLIDFWAERA